MSLKEQELEVAWVEGALRSPPRICFLNSKEDHFLDCGLHLGKLLHSLAFGFQDKVDYGFVFKDALHKAAR